MVNASEQALRERTGPDHAGQTRIFELDALRGIAACVVVLHHLHLMLFVENPRRVFRPFFAGHAGVILFFILSGYVLSLAFWKKKHVSYPRFLVRRIFRIYGPYAAACILAILVARPLLNATLPLTPWFYQTWHTPLTAPLIASHLLLMQGNGEINTAFWSLRYEMEASILFPLLCAAILRLRTPASALLAILTAITGAWLIQRDHTFTAGPGAMLFYASCFLTGALLSFHRAPIAALYARLPRPAKFPVIALGTLSWFLSQYDLTILFFASVLIVVAQQRPLRGILRAPLPEYLGRISYSLYLVHGTVLFAAFILLYGKLPLPAVCAIYLVASFALAHAFNRLVEEPFDRVGRHLTRRSETHRLPISVGLVD